MNYTFNDLVNHGWITIYGSEHGWSIAALLIGYAVAAVIAYLLGSLNFGVIISKYKYHEDIRTFGSGNAGMTNMLRTYGKAAAGFTLFGDAAKAMVSVMIGQLLCGTLGGYIAGLFCMVGHVYPLYFGFKGGKGVVVTAATILMLNPAVFTICFVVFVAIVATTKYISLGSIMGALIFPLVLNGVAGSGPHVIVAIIMALFVVYLHRGNIQRLRSGTENKLSFTKKDKKKAPGAENPNGGEK